MLFYHKSTTIDLPESSQPSIKSLVDAFGQAINLPLTLLEKRCLEETAQYFKDQSPDGRYCFELFRRALIEKSQDAWELLYRHYRPQVFRRLRRCNRLANLDEDPAVLVNEVFAKFAHAVSPEKFATFGGLKSVLRYLNLCTDSVVIDYLRKRSLDEHEISWELAEKCESPQTRIEREELFELIMSRLKDEQEQTVFHAMFNLGMKPSEVCIEWPQLLPTVRRVNQVRQNIVDRLKRDEILRRYYENVY